MSINFQFSGTGDINGMSGYSGFSGFSGNSGFSGFSNSSREMLTANRTYYVNSSTGSDSNNGLTSITPFLTIQKAFDTIASIDLSLYTVTVQLADGTYTESSFAPSVVYSGLGAITGDIPRIIIKGNTSVPENVILSGDAPVTTEAVNVPVHFEGVYYTGGFGINSYRSNVTFANVNFGCQTHISVDRESHLVATGNYTISSGADYHVIADNGSFVDISNGITVTLTGTPDFTGCFASSLECSVAHFEGATFVGSATGSRYNVDLNAVINTGGRGANYLPGDTTGTTDHGGVYV